MLYSTKKWLSDKKYDIIVFISYIILTIIFTYPVAFSKNEIPGDGGDGFWYLWDFWWFKEALSTLTNPYYTSYIYHPIGGNLAFSEVTPFNAIISIPLQRLFGLVASYNIIWILTFILSGYGMYLLVKYLTKDRRTAFISGLIFMFCPYRFAHALGHPNLISTQWLPLYVLYLIKILNEKRSSNVFLGATFLFLTTLSSYYYLIYSVIFTVLYLSYRQSIYRDVLKSDVTKRVSMMSIFFGVMASPFMYPPVKELLASKSSYMYSGGFDIYSADLLAFFLPSILHPTFKDLVTPIYYNFTGNVAEYTVFIGYTIMILSIISVLKVKNADVKFWAISAMLYFILCLGPILHINGILSIPINGYDFNIPLPYTILMKIPVFSLARVPSRWYIMLILSLAVLSGYGLKFIFDKYNNPTNSKRNRTRIIFIIVSCLILFEFLAIPYPMSSAEIHPFYYQLSNDNESYSIIEVPNYNPILTNTDYMYYQTAHKKKLINGYMSRIPNNVTEYFINTPIINNLLILNPQGKYEDIINQDMDNIALSILNYHDIRYVILHPDRMTVNQMKYAEQLLNGSSEELPKIYKNNSIYDKTISIYKIKNTSLATFTLLGKGWYPLGDWNGKTYRWMENDATIMIYSDDNRTFDLSLNALSFHNPRTIKIYVNDQIHTEAKVPSNGFMTISVPKINLNKGANIVRFHIPEGCERPADIPELNNPDSRCFSLAIQEVKIAEDILINNLDSSFISLGDGWHVLEDWSGAPSRWMENDAILMIDSEENRSAELSFRARSYNRPRTLELYDSEDNLIGEATISENFREIKMPIELEVGANSIRLHTPEGCDRPNVVSEGKSKDGRCLSLAFQEIKITGDFIILN